MEKAKAFFQLTQEESEQVSGLTVHPHQINTQHSFYEDFATRGIRVDRMEPGFLSCTFKVPPRLIDRDGNLASGAIASLVDEVGAAAVQVEGLPMIVSVDMSISYLSAAKVDNIGAGLIHNFVTVSSNLGAGLIHNFVTVSSNLEYVVEDELEITSRALGQRGGYLGTSVLFRNKATGEIVAEGRHSLFSKHASKL